MSGSASAAERDTGVSRTSGRGKGRKKGFFSKVKLFVRQVVAELKKVVWPTRNQLLTYTSVVLVFVLIVMGYIGALDFAVGRLVLWVFGG